MKAFSDDDAKELPKAKKTMYIICSEASLQKRRAKASKDIPLSLVEFCHIVTEPLSANIQRKNRLYLPGTTQTDLMGPFDVPDNDVAWNVKHSEKAKIYGSAMVESGGRVEGDNVEADPAPKGSDDVPLNYFSNDPRMYEEMDHMCNSLAWVDLTASNTDLCLQCVKKQKPYLGFLWTDAHLTAFKARIEQQVFELFQTQGSPLFEAGFVDLLQELGREARSLHCPPPSVRTLAFDRGCTSALHTHTHTYAHMHTSCTHVCTSVPAR